MVRSFRSPAAHQARAPPLRPRRHRSLKMLSARARLPQARLLSATISVRQLDQMVASGSRSAAASEPLSPAEGPIERPRYQKASCASTGVKRGREAARPPRGAAGDLGDIINSRYSGWQLHKPGTARCNAHQLGHRRSRKPAGRGGRPPGRRGRARSCRPGSCRCRYWSTTRRCSRPLHSWPARRGRAAVRRRRSRCSSIRNSSSHKVGAGPRPGRGCGTGPAQASLAARLPLRQSRPLTGAHRPSGPGRGTRAIGVRRSSPVRPSVGQGR